MKRENIDSIFTKVVGDMIAKGYTVNLSTMNGSQGEVGKIDLRKDNEFVRVWVEQDYYSDERYYHRHALVLKVGYTSYDNAAKGWTIWNDRLELRSVAVFGRVGEGEYLPIEEAKPIWAEHAIRRAAKMENDA